MRKRRAKPRGDFLAVLVALASGGLLLDAAELRRWKATAPDVARWLTDDVPMPDPARVASLIVLPESRAAARSQYALVAWAIARRWYAVTRPGVFQATAPYLGRIARWLATDRHARAWEETAARYLEEFNCT